MGSFASLRMTNLADSDRFAQHDSYDIGDAGRPGSVATVGAFLTAGRLFSPNRSFPYGVAGAIPYCVVVGASTSAFHDPSACLPHTTTYLPLLVCGRPRLSFTVSA